MACDSSSGFCIGAVLCQNCCFSSAVLEAELSNPLWFFCLIPTVRAAGLSIHRSNVVETTVVSLVLQKLWRKYQTLSNYVGLFMAFPILLPGKC